MDVPAALIVDDHEPTRKLLWLLLDDHFEMAFAATPNETLQAVDEAASTFDLLIVDINLGADINGMDLLREIQQQAGYEDVAALACTAYAMPGDREQLLDGGFGAYLSKPFVRSELMQTLEQLLDLDLSKPAGPS